MLGLGATASLNGLFEPYGLPWALCLAASQCLICSCALFGVDDWPKSVTGIHCLSLPILIGYSPGLIEVTASAVSLSIFGLIFCVFSNGAHGDRDATSYHSTIEQISGWLADLFGRGLEWLLLGVALGLSTLTMS